MNETQISLTFLGTYWSDAEIATNLVVFMNLLGALALGLIVGYERSYHGRAAGMRTYGLVCTASAALTVIVGYPAYWYGGHANIITGSDPTRVIQGIVTGIGFLGAGVIMKEGFTISGLTTSASIWASSAIGVLVGIGFYGAAILLTLLSVFCMLGVSRLEAWLPNRQAVMLILRFRQGFVPRQEVLVRAAHERGYDIALGTLVIDYKDGRAEWRFIAVSRGRSNSTGIAELSSELTRFDGVETFHISHARN